MCVSCFISLYFITSAADKPNAEQQYIVIERFLSEILDTTGRVCSWWLKRVGQNILGLFTNNLWFKLQDLFYLCYTRLFLSQISQSFIRKSSYFNHNCQTPTPISTTYVFPNTTVLHKLNAAISQTLLVGSCDHLKHGTSVKVIFTLKIFVLAIYVLFYPPKNCRTKILLDKKISLTWP